MNIVLRVKEEMMMMMIIIIIIIIGNMLLVHLERSPNDRKKDWGNLKSVEE